MGWGWEWGCEGAIGCISTGASKQEQIEPPPLPPPSTTTLNESLRHGRMRFPIEEITIPPAGRHFEDSKTKKAENQLNCESECIGKLINDDVEVRH